MFNWFKTISPAKKTPHATVAVLPIEPPIQTAAPDKGAAYKNRGDQHLKEGKFEEAAECYRQAIAIHPGYAEACNMLGNALNGLGRPAEAVDCYRKAIALKPDYAGAMNNLGNMLHDRGNMDEAVACFQKALILMPDDAGIHGNLAVAFRDQGKLDEAVECYRKALKIKPDDVEMYSHLGNILRETGRLEEAEVSYRRALQVKPDFADAHNNLGITLKDMGRLDEAVDSYRRALGIKPGFAEALSNLGLILQGMGRLDEAEANYRRALQVKPDYAEAHYNLGNALNDMGRLNEAEASYRRALEIKPNFAEAHSNMGNTLKDTGRLDDAEASFLRALQIKPDFAEAHSNLGNTLKEIGRLDDAGASFLRALQIRPDFAEAHGNLGNVLKEMCRLDEAEASYRRALEIKPDFAMVHSHLGDTLRDMGRLSEAEASYRRALETKPDNALRQGRNVSQLVTSHYGQWLYRRGLHRESVRYFQQAFAERVGWHHDGDKDLSSGLVYANIELTNKCNFHCDFCPSDSQQRIREFMGLELIRRIYDEFAEKNLVQQVHLHLMGEPTLHPDLMEVLAYASAKNIKTDLVTNGSTLNAKTIPKILDAFYGILAISLQTPTRETFKHRGNAGLGWDRYIANIRLLVREYLKRIAQKRACRGTLELRVMVTRDSKLSANIIESSDDIRDVMHEWRDFVAALEIEFGLSPFNRKELSPEALATQAAQAEIKYPLQQGLSLSFWQGFTFANSMLSSAYALENKKTATFCSRPFIDVAVLSNGDVTLCCLDYDGKLAVGNVKDNSIEAILNGKQTMDLRAAMYGRHPLPHFCQQCQAEPVLSKHQATK